MHMMTPMQLRNLLAVPLVALIALCALPAHAQTVEERVDLLLGDAYADYDMLQLDAAEAKLFEAIDLVETYSVQTPGAAGAYIMLGVVWAARDGDSSLAYEPFVDGLRIDPLAELHPFYATPSLMETLEEARANAGQAQAPPPDPYVPPTPTPYVPPTPDPYVPPAPEPSQVLMHSRVTEARSNRDIEISAQVPASVPVSRVQLNYRPFGESNFYGIVMEPTSDGVSFVGEIPSSATRGIISIDYFLVALDRAGNPLGTAGSSSQPFTIFITGSSDGPSASRSSGSRNNNRNRNRSTGEGEIGHLSLGFGTGIGLATAEPNVYAEDVELNPGLAPAPFHIGVEAGFAPGRGSLHIVPYLRLQLVFLDTGIAPEPLFGVKARYFFKDGDRLRVYAQGSLGYGDVSHLVLLREIDEGTYDTTNEGPVHIGGGIGLVHMLSDTFGLQGDLHLMAMFGRFSLHADVTAGPYIAF